MRKTASCVIDCYLLKLTTMLLLVNGISLLLKGVYGNYIFINKLAYIAHLVILGLSRWVNRWI